MHLKLILFYICFTSIIAFPSTARSFQAPDTVQGSYKVGVFESPPFMIKSQQGQWDGISVDLWRFVADELNIMYELVETQPGQVIAQIENGALDMALALNANGEDAKRVSFSQVYYIAYMGVVSDTMQSLMSIFQGIFTQRFFRIVLFISILLLVVGTLIWLIERKANEDNFGGERNFWHGIGAGFWWAGVTMTTIGYGDKAPITFGGRAVALVWMLVAMAVTSSLTAAVVSAVGMGKSGYLQIPNDLKDKKVGSVVQSPAADYLQQHQVDFKTYEEPRQAMEALKQKEIEAFVFNLASLKYLSKEYAQFRSKVQPTQLNPRFFAFAMRQDFPLQKALDRALLKKVNDDSWPALLQRYLPD